MSCAGKGYGTNLLSNDYLYAQFGSSFISDRSARICRKYTHGFLPSFTPVIYHLSMTTSKSGIYARIYIKGANFLPNGTTLIKFGSMGIVPSVFYTSSLLAFTVPLNAVAGNYSVQVVNVYNGNFSPQVNQSYPGIPNYSNPVVFVVT